MVIDIWGRVDVRKLSKNGSNRKLRVPVSLGERSYDIVIGPGLIGDASLWRSMLQAGRALVVTDSHVGKLYGDSLRETLDEIGVTVSVHALEAGERWKTLASWAAITDQLAKERHDRETTIIALGGGVVGDLAGFAAATWLRGVRYLQVPTTLLSQVDSSVGGKTGVNHALGKNLIGAFYQPVGVVADLDTLRTLPHRELIAGLAEIIKYGIIRDAAFFDFIEQHLDVMLSGDLDTLGHAVAHSCEIKAEVVTADERESGVREILNFGHTFAHALETLTEYANLNHGEAVALGMIMAAELSVAEGWLEVQARDRIVALIKQLPVLDRLPKGLGIQEIMHAFQSDKKTRAGRLRFVLARAIGSAATCENVSHDRLLGVLERFF